MIPSRYVPSSALIRALARPQPLRCPFARRANLAVSRTKTSKTAAAAKAKARADARFDAKANAKASATPNPKADATASAEPTVTAGPNKYDITFDSNVPNVPPITFRTPRFETDDEVEAAMRPPSDEELQSPDMPVINLYEQDLDTGAPRRLIERIATPNDRMREKEMFNMIEESQRRAGQPDYDDAPLNRRLIDSLLSNPNFADLTQELKDIKAGIKTKEEIAEIDAQEEQKVEREVQQMNANLRMSSHRALQELIDDPDVGDARPALQQALDNMPEVDDMDNPAFQAMFDKALAQLSTNPAFQAKMAARAQDVSASDDESEWARLEQGIDAALAEQDGDDSEHLLKTPEDLEDVEKLLHQMRDVLRSFGDNSVFEAELDGILSDDSTETDEINFEREMDPEELAAELTKLARSKADSAPVKEDELQEDEEIPAELQAKVDKIMADPKLMEKLLYIQSLITQQQSDMTNLSHPVAPDPTSLANSETATLGQRLAAARSDPEHAAALASLHVVLPSPFNIAPALKSFNQALELSYVGANDDVRRILWRTYTRAKSLPTFLQSVGDEAWDLLYYSQAVTWRGNRNREQHLRILLEDLKRIGKDGPPTHPSQLG
jgi:hypothetical protein